MKTYHYRPEEPGFIDSHSLPSEDGQTWREAADACALAEQTSYAVLRGGNGSVLVSLSGDEPKAEPCPLCAEWATEIDIRGEPRCREHVTACSQKGCGLAARRWASPQCLGLDGDHKEDTARPYCEGHALERMRSGRPEYVGKCPRPGCGCIFGVN